MTSPDEECCRTKANAVTRRWKFTRAPRSTPISSDNDSLRWDVYPPSIRAWRAPKPHRVSAFSCNGVSGLHRKVSRRYSGDYACLWRHTMILLNLEGGSDLSRACRLTSPVVCAHKPTRDQRIEAGFVTWSVRNGCAHSRRLREGAKTLVSLINGPLGGEHSLLAWQLGHHLFCVFLCFCVFFICKERLAQKSMHPKGTAYHLLQYERRQHGGFSVSCLILHSYSSLRLDSPKHAPSSQAITTPLDLLGSPTSGT